VPRESESAEGKDDPARSEDVEWWKSKQYPNWRDDQDSDKECCKSRASSRRSSSTLGREKVCQRYEGLEQDIAAHREDTQDLNYLVKTLMMRSCHI
jgi:hypothetical protein